MQDLKIFFELHRTDLISFESVYFIFFVIFSLVVFHLFHRSKIILLILNLLFYSAFSLKMTYFILILALINYAGGMVLYLKKSYILCILLVLVNLSMLMYYKYFNFFIDSLHSLKLFSNIDTLSYLVVPLGISFFTFELMHYIIDIYKGKKPVFNIIHYLNFVFFFPTLFAGPIKRFENFVPQLKKTSKINFYENSLLIIKGLSKKIILADNLSNFSNYGFQTQTNSLVTLVGIFAFSLQIYFDFSGYTDVARGTAGLLGVHIPENFISPYTSKNIKEFWRRWHITLMLWIRDYIYFPLGGSKKGKLRQIINLLVIFMISGLWHGAAWHFVVWGLYHGFLIAGYTLVKNYSLMKIKFGTKFSILITFMLVTFGWVSFRAASVTDALRIFKQIFQLNNYYYLDKLIALQLLSVVLLLCLYLLLPHIFKRLKAQNFAYYAFARN
ncbi:MAG: MBOAT family O-acyltransferase, partial [Candidatus Levybacteria bacterium]|nr:MBOAT family O-acyltransferase [Candidatus Levybacteria bacterium]